VGAGVKLPLTPLDFLARARRLFPERVGVVQGDDVRMTYAAFARRCDALATLLRDDVGIGRGDRVAFLAGNVHELLEAYYSVLLAGGVLLPLNIRNSAPELSFCLDDARAAALFRDATLPDPGFDGPTFVLGVDDWGETSAGFEPDAVDEDAPAELFYTSGSTGRPKGALLSHRALYLHAVHIALTNGIGGNDVLLHTIPLFHVNGWGTAHFLTGLGGTHVMLPRFDAAGVLKLVERERVTRLFLVPTMARTLLDHPDVRTRDLSSVVQISVGGAASTPELLAELEDTIGCEAICGYGMTESSPTLTRSLDKPGTPKSRTRRATTGLPIIGVDLRVLDDADEEVPWDGTTVGEICARSNHVMIGYLDRPEETAEALRGGWLRTGDLGVVDAEGYVTIVDRRKDLIVSGGENIASVEVEAALDAHPAVREAAVVGMPDERWGEVPCAFVAFHDGRTATEAELVDWVQSRLARFKTPKRIVVLDELPKGGTGKVAKTDLRARLAAAPTNELGAGTSQ
jgi:fatty-acyl-CoA synthase